LDPRRRRRSRRFATLGRRRDEAALDARKLNLVSVLNRLLLNRFSVDPRFVGTSQIDNGHTVARDEDLRVEFTDEVVREADPIRRIPPDGYLVAENGMVDFFAVRKLNDQLRDFG
jgi:hypothetical protein